MCIRDRFVSVKVIGKLIRNFLEGHDGEVKPLNLPNERRRKEKMANWREKNLDEYYTVGLCHTRLSVVHSYFYSSRMNETLIILLVTIQISY